MLDHYFFRKTLEEQKVLVSNMDNKVMVKRDLIFYGARADLTHPQIREIENLISFVEHLLREEYVHMRNDRIHEDYEY